jgi:microtubule-associated protein-like 5
VICTIKELLLFQYYEGHFLTKEVNFELYEDVKSPLTCATAIRLNINNPYLKAYQDDVQSTIAIITGHQNGAVYLWENFQTFEEVPIIQYNQIHQYKDQIVCITTY